MLITSPAILLAAAYSGICLSKDSLILLAKFLKDALSSKPAVGLILFKALVI